MDCPDAPDTTAKIKVSNRKKRAAFIGMNPFRLIGPKPGGPWGLQHAASRRGGGESTAKRGIFFEERRIRHGRVRALSCQWHFGGCCALRVCAPIPAQQFRLSLASHKTCALFSRSDASASLQLCSCTSLTLPATSLMTGSKGSRATLKYKEIKISRSARPGGFWGEGGDEWGERSKFRSARGRPCRCLASGAALGSCYLMVRECSSGEWPYPLSF
jgi:hypothetical protein